MDLDRLRIPDAGWQYSTPPTQRKRNKRRGEFIKGPIPIAWIELACMQGGKAAGLAWLLHFKAGMTKGKPVKVTRELLKRFNVSTSAAYRALDAMESAGLISVQRRRGASPIVAVLEVVDVVRGDE